MRNLEDRERERILSLSACQWTVTLQESRGSSCVHLHCTSKRRQWSIESAFAEKLDQVKLLKLYYNFFIGDILPARITDSQNLRNFLSYAIPNFQVPFRQKLTRDMAQLSEEAKDILSDLLSKVNWWLQQQTVVRPTTGVSWARQASTTRLSPLLLLWRGSSALGQIS
jgi:hypothetical protein